MSDIASHIGLTEDEIVRVAQRVSFGQDITDIREMYAQEGKSRGDATLAFLAAKTYLTISAKSFLSHRQQKPTVREMRAIKLPR